MIHVAAVSAYPTEHEARMAIAEGLHVIALGQFRGCPYLGVWILPPPYEAVVHVFSDDADPARLEADGWVRSDG